MATVVRMPEVLTGITEAAISAWLVSPGEEVAVGTPLAEIETEKAVVEYASEVEGTVLELFADAGAGVAIGDPIVAIGAPGESVDEADVPAATPDAAPAEPSEDAAPLAGTSAAPAPAPSVAEAAEEVPAAGADAGAGPAAAPSAAPQTAASGERRFVSPLVRRLAKERGIDLDTITGTGPNGRIVRRDLEAAEATSAGAPAAPSPAPAAAAAPAPAAVSAPAGDTEDVPLTPMRRAIARRLTESKSTVPHYYLVADVRVDKLLALRAQVNEAASVRVSVNDFVLKAVAAALRAVPDANVTWGETVLHRHQSVDIAMAVAIEGGLVTPVLREVDRMSLGEIARSVADLAERARAGRLKQHELEGGSFSVSNLGMYGTQEFSAIINPPHAGILAVGAATARPVVEDGELAVGTVMTVTVSADHRVLDGALAAQWLAALVKGLENPLTLLI